MDNYNGKMADKKWVAKERENLAKTSLELTQSKNS